MNVMLPVSSALGEFGIAYRTELGLKSTVTGRAYATCHGFWSKATSPFGVSCTSVTAFLEHLVTHDVIEPIWRHRKGFGKCSDYR